MNSKFQGTGVALVTPFKNGKVDYPGLENVINHCISGGCEFLVSLGTTGESATLSESEKNTILDFTRKTANNKVPLVAGFGGNNTAKVVDSIRNFNFEGYSAILSVSPAYNKPTQEGIFQHFMAIQDFSALPIILYNVPGRTSSNMTAETTLRLARASKKFCAVKEASGNMVQCMEIIKNRPEGFLVLSGDDVLTLPMLGFGADGVISVVANAFPEIFSNMVRAALAEKFPQARPLHYKLLEIIDLLFVEGNPGGVKSAMEILGICSREVRLPLADVSEKTYQKLAQEIKKLQHAHSGQEV